ncbi:MAG: leucine-rich repeat protein [Eubacterium sp.]|nr:leucine-rich repeat protein [Eubacterium sp.]
MEKRKPFLITLMTIIMVLFILPWIGNAKEVNAASDVITRIDLGTSNDINEPFEEYSFVDQPEIFITNIQSTNGIAKDSDFDFESEKYGWCMEAEDHDWYSYSIDGVQNLYFTSGNSRFMVNMFVRYGVSGITFSDDCEFYVNGIEMTEYCRTSKNDDVTYYFERTASHITPGNEDEIEEIYFNFPKGWPCAGQRAGSYTYVEATKIKLKSGRMADDGLIEHTGVWNYWNAVTNEYKPYGKNDVFYQGDSQYNVTININTPVIDGYKLSNDLKVYLKDSYSLYGYYDLDLLTRYDDNKAEYIITGCSIYDPQIDIEAYDINGFSDSKVCFEGKEYKSSDHDYILYGNPFTIKAQADDDSEFVEWRKDSDSGEVVSTSTSFNLTAYENAKYYAIFRKKLKATGDLGNTASYSFDEGTGTVTIYPKTAGVNGIPTCDYGKTPFLNDSRIKHVVIQEGITKLDNYVFIGNTIESLEIPASLTAIAFRAFDNCTFRGDRGITVDPGNTKFKYLDGSLLSYDGKTLYRFYQKTGCTEYTIPEGVTDVNHGCFYGADLKKLVIRNSKMTIVGYAIYGCNIDHFEIEEGVSTLPSISSYTTKDYYVTLPSTIEYLGDFLDNASYKDIYVSEDNPYYKSIGGVLYKKNSDGSLSLAKYPDGKRFATYKLAEEATGIEGHYTFNSNKYLKNIILPDDVVSIKSDAFFFMNDITVTVTNPECIFSSDAIYRCNNVTLKGYKGSTAQTYSESHNLNFVRIGDDNGVMGTPQNPGWDGYTAKWSEVENATRYYVSLYADSDNDGTPDNTYEFEVQASETELDLQYNMLRNSYDYWFTVKAAAPTYDVSPDSAASVIKNGRFTTDNDIELSLSVDTVSYSCRDDEGDLCSYYCRVKNMSDEQVGGLNYIGNYESFNIRKILHNIGAAYGKYKIYVSAYVAVTKTGGVTLGCGETLTPVIYDYKEISPVNRIELTIPYPEEGGKSVLTDELDIKAYSGEDILDAINLDSNNGYYYMNQNSSNWNKYGSGNTITRGKYGYAYKVDLNINTVYKYADEVDILVNGSSKNVSIDNKYSSYIRITYTFPRFEVENIPDQEWTGAEIMPEPQVTYGDKTLTKDTDYTLSYSNNTDVGIAKVTVAGIGDYLNTTEQSFKIVYPLAITGSCGDSVNYSFDPYTGKLTISGNGPMTDYTNADNSPFNDYASIRSKVKTIVINSGVTSIGDCSISGMPNCTSVTLPGSIERIGWGAFVGYNSLTEMTIPTSVKTIDGEAFYNNSIETVNYHGTPSSWKQVSLGERNEKLLTALKIDGHTHNYELSEDVPADCGNDGYKTYTCEECGMHYSEKTDDATGIHNYVVTIQKATPTEDGLYSEICSVCHDVISTPILKADRCELSATSVTYNGKTQTPSVTVANADDTLEESNYTVEYSGNLNAGTATVTINLVGEYYTGTITRQFTINPASVETAVISGIEDKVYTGSEIKQKLKVEMAFDGDKIELIEGTDYVVSYSDNIQVGTATVTITGKDNYTGSISKTFKITGAASNPDATPSPGTDVTPGPDATPAPGTEVTPTATPGTETDVTKPAKAVIKTSKNKKGKKLYVKWKKITGVDGYEVQYSLKKSFSKAKKAKTKIKSTAKTSITIKKLKKNKKYYVRVRAYKLDSSGNKIYGKWSKVKKVKVKK